MWALLGILLAPFRFARHHRHGHVRDRAVPRAFALLLLSIWFSSWMRTAWSPARLYQDRRCRGAITAWMFVLPLLRRSDYGDRADTHGSARFASAGEPALAAITAC
jgi:type IV secretion system protein VirD4